MKWYSRLFLITSVLTAVTLGWTPSAAAQTPPAPTLPSVPPEVEAALAYPNSSQRFFEEGNAQLEEEIQRLDDEQPEPVLMVRPEVTEQFED